MTEEARKKTVAPQTKKRSKTPLESKPLENVDTSPTPEAPPVETPSKPETSKQTPRKVEKLASGLTIVHS